MPKKNSDPKKTRDILPINAIGSTNAPTPGGNWAFSLIITFITLACFGYLAFRHDGTTIRGNELSQDRAFFTTINAITLTGFQTTWPGYNEFFSQGKIVTAILTLGGTLISLIVGGLAAGRILRSRFSDKQIVLYAIAWTIFPPLIAGGVMLIARTKVETMADPFFNALSAFANSGLYAGKLPDQFNWRAHGILKPLAILGSLGLPVLIELCDRVRGRTRLSKNTLRVLVSTAVIYLLGIAVLFGCSIHETWAERSETDEYPALHQKDFRDAIVKASLQANNARGPGFAYEFATELPRLTQWIIIGLMVVGGAGAAGTAGGIKSATLAEIFHGLRKALRSEPAARSFGIACVWAILFAINVLISFLLLLVFQPQVPTERLLFLTISAASNIGLSHEPVSIVGEGLYVLSTTMLVGRLLPLAILWWMALTTKDSDVAIG